MKKVKNTLLVFFVCLLANNAQAILIDKIVGVFDSQIITLSTIKRAIANLEARRTISSQVYPKTHYTESEMLGLFIESYLIRDKLNSIGYSVSDEQVEDQIKSTEKRLRLTRKELLSFLETNKITFEEYFEIIRMSIENNLFSSRVIGPLVSITEQQIKNKFYNSSANSKTLSFKYDLVDFTINPKDLTDEQQRDLPEVLTRYQSTGVLPDYLKNLESNIIEGVAEDGLNNELSAKLKKTDEGAFSSPLIINGLVHSFYVKKKDLVESQYFLKEKERIRDILFDEYSKQVKDVWLKREANKHYIVKLVE